MLVRQRSPENIHQKLRPTLGFRAIETTISLNINYYCIPASPPAALPDHHFGFGSAASATVAPAIFLDDASKVSRY